MVNFFSSLVPVDSIAVEATVAEAMYDESAFRLYILRVMAVLWAVLPLVITVGPFFACLELYKVNKKKAAEAKLALAANASSMEPLLPQEGSALENQGVGSSAAKKAEE